MTVILACNDFFFLEKEMGKKWSCWWCIHSFSSLRLHQIWVKNKGEKHKWDRKRKEEEEKNSRRREGGGGGGEDVCPYLTLQVKL